MIKFLCVLLSVALIVTSGYAQEDDWDDWTDDEEDWGEEGSGNIVFTGFVEGALGSRWESVPSMDKEQTLGDFRLRLETEWDFIDSASIGFKGEVWYDDILEEVDTEIRDLSLSFSPGRSIDVRLGRQVLTWGSGDLLFLNDLFSKNWVSFFSGREDEYLKNPTTAMRSTWYTDVVNVDVVWIPEFDPDEYLTGERFSFYSPVAGRVVAPDPPLNAAKHESNFGNSEWSMRLFKTVSATEYAFYAYRGYFHSPNALTDTFQPAFAPLAAIGASLRRPLGAGLFNVETVYYFSRDDRSGDNPNLPNDQVRLLLGYEREAITNFTVALQYYLEWTQDYGQLIANSPTSELEPDEFRHVLTTRLTYRLNQDKLIFSLFGFYSPGDRDYYIRPVTTYRYDDNWSFTFGANIFGGADESTFFGQFADNTNLYLRVRFNY